jgi:hypothetical protein
VRSNRTALVQCAVVRSLAGKNEQGPTATLVIGPRRKLDQCADRNVSHLRGGHSTPITPRSYFSFLEQDESPVGAVGNSFCEFSTASKGIVVIRPQYRRSLQCRRRAAANLQRATSRDALLNRSSNVDHPVDDTPAKLIGRKTVRTRIQFPSPLRFGPQTEP